jgi:hypothetical protein
VKIPGFNLLPVTGTPVSAVRTGQVHVALFVVSEPRRCLALIVQRAQTNNNL